MALHVWLWMVASLLTASIHSRLCFFFSLPHYTHIHVWFAPQGSESESVNGPGRDSGLASSRLEPSATLPSRGGAESEPDTMEGMLCRKQEMESHSKKAATRWVFLRGESDNVIDLGEGRHWREVLRIYNNGRYKKKKCYRYKKYMYFLCLYATHAVSNAIYLLP